MSFASILRSGETALLCCAALLCTGAAEMKWDSYVNNRFTYMVEYPPSLMRAEPVATNDDGREFHARSGTAKVAVWGQYIDDQVGPSPLEFAGITEKECADGKAAYRLKKPLMQAVSCVTAKGEVLYYKSSRRKDVLVVIEAHYPQAEKAQWDPVVTHMSKSIFVGDPD